MMNLKIRSVLTICFTLICSTLIGATLVKEWKSGIPWLEPVVVTPGDGSTPPSDAVVLFDGKDLSKWDAGKGWTVQDGYAQAGGEGGITSKQAFGDCQLHIEWATPAEVKGEGQGRGNSGVYMMNKYELQILDSYENKTYFDGQCGAIYKQYPPLVNACRKPGEWQRYDIIFTAPRFCESGDLKSPAYMTVFQNGVLIQNHVEIQGNTFWASPPSYEKHAEKLPIHIQNHGNPIRIRNVWVREIRSVPVKQKKKV